MIELDDYALQAKDALDETSYNVFTQLDDHEKISAIAMVSWMIYRTFNGYRDRKPAIYGARRVEVLVREYCHDNPD